MSEQRYPTVVLFGAPGVGKGTQGKILGQLAGFFHHSSGEVFRALDRNSLDGREVAKFASRGELVPDDLTIRIWKSGLESEIAAGRYDPVRSIIILDGIPRNVAQAKILEPHVDVLQVVHLVCSNEDEMVKRMKQRALEQNRADDADENVIRHRFAVYHRETEPLLEFYPHDLVCNVEAIATPAEVLRDVLDCVIPVQNRVFGRRG
jgi:adenylate kinase